MLRDPSCKIEAVSRLVGYGSTKNFYAALRHLTGLTPRQARDLHVVKFERLRGGALRLVTEVR